MHKLEHYFNYTQNFLERFCLKRLVRMSVDIVQILQCFKLHIIHPFEMCRNRIQYFESALKQNKVLSK